MTSIRAQYESQLQALQDDMLLMGSMVETAIKDSIDALKRRDLKASARIVDEDQIINRKRFDIENKAVEIMSTQQPTARDLRMVLAILYIVTDLERMGDHARGIAKISLLIGDRPLPKPLIDIPRMADLCGQMLHRSFDAWIQRDVQAAKAIGNEDDLVDSLYGQVYRELLTIMLEDPSTITVSTHLLWAAHNLERIADRVTNLCERVIYTVTGEMQEMNSSVK